MVFHDRRLKRAVQVTRKMSGKISNARAVGIAIAIFLLVASVEYFMGRTPLCTCGKVRLWVGDIHSAELSQQIADWYSFSHIIHGFALYGIFRLIGRGKWNRLTCMLLALGIEGCWEMLENSPIIIDRYRESAIAAGYVGDSILNSICDILFCLLGYTLAWVMPVWTIVLATIVMEVGVLLAIRDNLTLNIIMLLHPFEAIRRWQTGA